MTKNTLSQKEIKELFYYSNVGALVWKINNGSNKTKGKVAGTISLANGYCSVQIKKKIYKVHRLIYIYHFGSIPDYLVIDHIDRNKENNKVENLRVLPNQENTFNSTIRKGYTYNKRNGKYLARICIDGKNKRLGEFKSEQEARQEYLKAKKELHFKRIEMAEEVLKNEIQCIND